MLESEFYERCESIALRMRHMLSLPAYAPLPSHRVASKLEIDVLCPGDLTSMTQTDIEQAMDTQGWAAITVLTQPAMIIRHPHRDLVQAESDIMHELAHVLLEHKPERLGHISEFRVARTYSKVQEYQADTLADYLQVPRAALYYLRQRGDTLDHIMGDFCISSNCYERRVSLERQLKAWK